MLNFNDNDRIKKCICGQPVECHEMSKGFSILNDPRCGFVELPPACSGQSKYAFRAKLNALRNAYLRNLHSSTPVNDEDEQNEFVALHHFHPKVVHDFANKTQMYKIPMTLKKCELQELGLNLEIEDRADQSDEYFFVPNYSFQKARSELRSLMNQSDSKNFREAIGYETLSPHSNKQNSLKNYGKTNDSMKDNDVGYAQKYQQDILQISKARDGACSETIKCLEHADKTTAVKRISISFSIASTADTRKKSLVSSSDGAKGMGSIYSRLTDESPALLDRNKRGGIKSIKSKDDFPSFSHHTEESGCHLKRSGTAINNNSSGHDFSAAPKYFRPKAVWKASLDEHSKHRKAKECHVPNIVFIGDEDEPMSDLSGHKPQEMKKSKHCAKTPVRTVSSSNSPDDVMDDDSVTFCEALSVEECEVVRQEARNQNKPMVSEDSQKLCGNVQEPKSESARSPLEHQDSTTSIGDLKELECDSSLHYSFPARRKSLQRERSKRGNVYQSISNLLMDLSNDSAHTEEDSFRHPPRRALSALSSFPNRFNGKMNIEMEEGQQLESSLSCHRSRSTRNSKRESDSLRAMQRILSHGKATEPTNVKSGKSMKQCTGIIASEKKLESPLKNYLPHGVVQNSPRKQGDEPLFKLRRSSSIRTSKKANADALRKPSRQELRKINDVLCHTNSAKCA